MENSHLLDDIAGEFDSRLRQRRAAEATDLAAAEAAEISLAGRLLASRGQVLELRLSNGESLRGTVDQASSTWLVLGLNRARVLLWYRGIELVSGLGTAPQWPSLVEQRIPATVVLREFSRERTPVQCATQTMTRCGLITRVGQDFIDITDHGREETLAIAALLSVSCPR